jgi:2-phosphosulfolactate phosphatase
VSSEPTPAGQGDYQVRFDWGIAGAAAVGQDADAVIWVDQLGESPGSPGSVAGVLERAQELAEWALEQQQLAGGRFRIAVVAAGAARQDGSLRFAVEDLLAAGAVIEAIAERGIDHQSPEAAAAAAAYRGLSSATRHLISASVSARESREG